MNPYKTFLACFLILFFLGGCTAITYKPKKQAVTLPQGTLNAVQLRTLFSGNTVKSVLDENGRISLTYYSPDGRLSQLRRGVKRFGTWRIKKNGRICLKFEGKRERCRIVVKEGYTYRKYIVKKDGNHRPIITYASFRKGNLLGPRK